MKKTRLTDEQIDDAMRTTMKRVCELELDPEKRAQLERLRDRQLAAFTLDPELQKGMRLHLRLFLEAVEDIPPRNTPARAADQARKTAGILAKRSAKKAAR